MSKNEDYLRDVIEKLADSFIDLCHFLLSEKCISETQHKELLNMMKEMADRSKYNWALHELADQVDAVSEKLTTLADACHVTKHAEDGE